jgi:hypothetical protein
LGNINLTNWQLSIDTKNKSTRTYKNDYIPTSNAPEKILNITSVIDSDTDAQKLKELFNNKNLSVTGLDSNLTENINGVYQIISGSVDQQGGKSYYTMKAALSGKADKYLSTIGEEIYITHWDELDSCADGDYTNLQNYTAAGNVSDAGNYIQIGSNSAGADLNFGYLYWSDYIIESSTYISTDSTGDERIRIFLRYLDSNNYYVVELDPYNNKLNFIKSISGSETTVNSINMSFEDDVWYNTKVKALQNKFMIYATETSGIDEVPKEVMVAYDDEIKCGKIGFGRNDTYAINLWIDNVVVTLGKPVVLHLPVGAYNINNVTVPSTDRQHDYSSKDGSFLSVVEPDGAVKYKQEDIVSSFNDPTAGNVRVWDTNSTDTEANWIEVLDIKHIFNDAIAVDNGIVRFNTRGLTNEQFYLGCYTNSAWEDVKFESSWSSLSFSALERGIIYMSPAKVIIREVAFFSSGGNYDSVWTDFIIERGSSAIKIINKRGL